MSCLHGNRDRRSIPKPDELEMLLAAYAPQDKGRYLRVRCPACHKHEAYIYKTGRTLRCNRLNKCGFEIDIQELVHMSTSTLKASQGRTSTTLWQHGVASRASLPEIGQEKERISMLSPQDCRQRTEALDRYRQALIPGSPAARYLQWRRIAFETAVRFSAGYSAPGAWCHFAQGRPVRQWRYGHVVFPLENMRGDLINLHARALDTRGASRALKLTHDTLPGPKGLFNARILQHAQTVFLCEGIFDALTLVQLGIESVVATIGAGSLPWRWFRNVKKMVICFDIDAAGEREFCRVARTAGLSRFTVHRLPAEIYGGQKDLNEALRAGALNGIALFTFCRRHNLLEGTRRPNTPLGLIHQIVETFDGESV